MFFIESLDIKGNPVIWNRLGGYWDRRSQVRFSYYLYGVYGYSSKRGAAIARGKINKTVHKDKLATITTYQTKEQYEGAIVDYELSR